MLHCSEGTFDVESGFAKGPDRKLLLLQRIPKSGKQGSSLLLSVDPAHDLTRKMWWVYLGGVVFWKLTHSDVFLLQKVISTWISHSPVVFHFSSVEVLSAYKPAR